MIFTKFAGEASCTRACACRWLKNSNVCSGASATRDKELKRSVILDKVKIKLKIVATNTPYRSEDCRRHCLNTCTCPRSFSQTICRHRDDHKKHRPILTKFNTCKNKNLHRILKVNKLNRLLLSFTYLIPQLCHWRN